MKKCLVTQLKGDVNDNSLLKLGEVRVKTTISQQTGLQFGSSGSYDGEKEYTIEILSNDGYFVDGNTKTYTTSKTFETKQVAASSYPCELILSYMPKKNAGFVGGFFYNDPLSIGEMVNVKRLSIKGFISGLSMLDMDDLATISPDSLEVLELPNFNDVGCKVKNITVLRNYKKLLVLSISGLTTTDTPITLESILDAWHTAGRVSGNVTVNSFNQLAISYNNTILYGSKSFTFSAEGWSENT